MGQFKYTCMPFGFCNSLSIFMRYINTIFDLLVKQNKVLIYLDDILISTQTINEHINILIEVFRIMSENCLELRIDKCSFLQQTIQYLEYEVSFDDVKPNPHNILAIKNFLISKNS